MVATVPLSSNLSGPYRRSGREITSPRSYWVWNLFISVVLYIGAFAGLRGSVVLSVLTILVFI